MRAQSLVGSLVCFTALSCASPIGSPQEGSNSPVEKRDGLIEKRNGLVPDSLVPTTTVNPATWSTGIWTGTPLFMPTSTVVLGKRDITSIPNLVPTTTVNLATDTGGTFTGTPDFMPTKVVKLGTTTGCEVSMSAYTTDSSLAYSYVTHCSDGYSPPTEAASI